jgi:hypothetical protein
MNHTTSFLSTRGSYQLHHPADASDPNSIVFDTWPGLRRPFEHGLVVMFSTGGDGGFSFRITDGDLTPEERERETCRCSFRYVVRHKLVHIDGGYGDPKQGFQFKMPNGNYRVTVHAIDREEHEGEKKPSPKLPGYVVRWESVASLAEIEPPEGYPWLVGLRGETLRLNTSIYEPTEEPIASERLKVEYTLLLIPGQVLFPNTGVTITTTRDWIDAHQSEQFVVVEDETVPRIGTLGRFSCGSGNAKTGVWTMAVHGERLVRLTAIRKKKGQMVGRVEPINRPTTKATPAAIRKLIAEYERVGLRYPEPYRRIADNLRPAYHAHQVELLKLMKTTTGVFLRILQHESLPLDRAFVRELFTLSDADRVANLRAALAKL